MRLIIILIFILLLYAFIGCEAQDNSAQQFDDSEVEVMTPKMDLHAAIVTNNLKIIKQHIIAGSDLNITEPTRNSTPIITAAFIGNLKAAELLVKAGAELNSKNSDGSTALHTASVFGKTAVAELLIESGCDLNVQNNEGATALHAAAFFCRVEIVEFLLKNNANKFIKNKRGNTAYEIVSEPFENAKPIYEVIERALKPLDFSFDYYHLKKARPLIAEMLKK